MSPINTHRIAQLPKCAWLLDWTGSELQLACGDNVELRAGFFAEGAWEGSFSPDGFSGSRFRCGSGVIVEGDSVRLGAPSHCLDPIYCFVRREFSRVLASNSLYLIWAACSEASFPPSSLGEVQAAAATLKEGKLAYRKMLYENAAGTMWRLAWDVFELNLARGELLGPLDVLLGEAPFGDFAEYRDYLISVLASLRDNARAAERRAPYGRLVTTCSSGYDSAACAALARSLGGDEAVTLTTCRGGDVDSGEAVAAALGFTCNAFERLGTTLETKPDGGEDFVLALADIRDQVPTEVLAEFLCSLSTAEDLIYAVFDRVAAGAVLLTGFHGDKIWNAVPQGGREMRRGDNSGSGMDEFRKRVGFVNVPVPFIGAQHYEAIRRIATGPEMSRFRSDQAGYNRPIPRRIAEEHGVPRDAFGQRKKAASVLFRIPQDARYRTMTAMVDRYRSALAGGWRP